MIPLVLSTVSTAFFHALAPDHWLPFVVLGKSSHWSRARLAFLTFLAGLGHVFSSLLIGLLGLLMGWRLVSIQASDATRAQVAVWALIGFGAAYALWGMKHAQHPHPHLEVRDAMRMYAVRRFWTLFAIVVFGPCEPMVPLMFLAFASGWGAVVFISLLFSLVTVGMVVGQSLLAFAGAQWFWNPWLQRYAHVLAGLVIVLTGVFVMVSGA
jgi:hypothetical protein